MMPNIAIKQISVNLMKVEVMTQSTPERLRRPTSLCRSWLFVAGAEPDAHARALESGADVLLIDLEDFTPAARRDEARDLLSGFFATAKARGFVVGARINPLETEDGPRDLAAAVIAEADIVAMSKVATAQQVKTLGMAVSALGNKSVELLPNVETARGLLNTMEIIAADPRVSACLVASEDMAADLGAERGKDGLELQYVRQKFLVQCVASGVLAIDCPYTWSDVDGASSDTDYARRLGYRAKSIISSQHVGVVNAGLTPDSEAIAKARELVDAYESARQAGEAGVEVAGIHVEMPIYMNAKRLIERAEDLKQADRANSL